MDELKKQYEELLGEEVSEEFFEEDEDEMFESEEDVANGAGFYVDDDGNWIPKPD